MDLISEHMQQFSQYIAAALAIAYCVGEYLVRHRVGLGDELNARIDSLFAKLTPVAELAARENQKS